MPRQATRERSRRSRWLAGKTPSSQPSAGGYRLQLRAVAGTGMKRVPGLILEHPGEIGRRPASARTHERQGNGPDGLAFCPLHERVFGRRPSVLWPPAPLMSSIMVGCPLEGAV